MKSLEDGRGSPFGEASDAELFALMAKRGDGWREAWAEFYRRYVSDFFRLVCRLRGLTNAEAEELVQEAMLQARKSAHTFRAVEGQDCDTARRRTLAWLGRIARNLHYEKLRVRLNTQGIGSERRSSEEGASSATVEEPRISRGELQRRISEAHDAVAEIARSSDVPVSDEKRLLRDALSTLTERELDVLLVSYEYYERGEEHPHLPRAVIAELCERHQTSPTNLRKIRERARKQVWQYVRENSPAEMKRKEP
jgi:DNA-directed RNA polymerase specialized sigma24 family protein